MPPLLPNDINVGQDCTITFSRIDTGEVFAATTLGHVMSFQAKAQNTKLECKPISARGRAIRRHIPNGWSGTIKFVRRNGRLTDLAIQLALDFFNLGELPLFNLQIDIQNRDGTKDTYVMYGCSLGDFDFGHFITDKEVEQELMFDAQYLERG